MKEKYLSHNLTNKNVDDRLKLNLKRNKDVAVCK